MHSGHITVIYALINVFHEGGEGGEKDENGMMARRVGRWKFLYRFDGSCNHIPGGCGGGFGSFSIFSLLAGRKIAS